MPSTNTNGTSASPVLRTEQLSKVYSDGQVQALVDINLDIHSGEFVTIMGPSGSGKSTLLMLLGGLETPSKGRVLVEGKPLSEFRSLDEYRAFKIGFVFQSFLLLPTLTAAENVQVPMFEGDLSASRRADRAAELLHIVGLPHRATHLPAQLSVGERQRVAIARSLANDPPILLADEPTGNLDTKSAIDILELFTKLNRERGITVIVVTHWDKVVSFGTRTIRLLDGRMVADEPVPKPA